MVDERKVERKILPLLVEGSTKDREGHAEYERKRYGLMRLPPQQKKPLMIKITLALDELDRLLDKDLNHRKRQ